MAAWMDSSTAPWWNMCFTELTGTSVASAGMQDVYVTAAKADNISTSFKGEPAVCALHLYGLYSDIQGHSQIMQSYGDTLAMNVCGFHM